MIGEKINNYEIVRLLGEGGMGAVYLAVHPFLERKAAIKILKPDCAFNQDYVQRFLNEARAANAIHHPNIIDIIDAGILPTGVPYMMMEFLQGESLADRLRRVNRLTAGEATFVAKEIAAALAAAHAVGIVHRDLKPENVFLVPNVQAPGQERVKVLDFGTAKLRPEFAPTTPRTCAGALMGTPAYMSPEQCMGKTSEIDHRADIYALGIILYKTLCGRTPFLGENFGEYFLQHITKPPQSPQSLNPDIPAHIDAIILKALAKEAQDRIQSMNDFADLLDGKTVLAQPALDQAFEQASGPVQPADSLKPIPSTPPKQPLSEPPIRKPTLRSCNTDPPLTTMSSTTGQIRRLAHRPHGAGNVRKTAAIVIGAICGVVALGGIARWNRSADPHSRTSQTAAAPLPPAPPAWPMAPSEAAAQLPTAVPIAPKTAAKPHGPSAEGTSETAAHSEETLSGEKDESATTEDGLDKHHAKSKWPSEQEIQSANEEYQRGNTKLFQGNTAGAIADFKRALELNPMDPSIHRGLGLAYAQSGRPAEATKHLSLYLKSSPKAHDRAVILKRIEGLQLLAKSPAARRTASRR